MTIDQALTRLDQAGQKWTRARQSVFANERARSKIIKWNRRIEAVTFITAILTVIMASFNNGNSPLPETLTPTVIYFGTLFVSVVTALLKMTEKMPFRNKQAEIHQTCMNTLGKIEDELELIPEKIAAAIKAADAHAADAISDTLDQLGNRIAECTAKTSLIVRAKEKFDAEIEFRKTRIAKKSQELDPRPSRPEEDRPARNAAEIKLTPRMRVVTE